MLKIAVQIEKLPCQETAFRPLINEIQRRKDTELVARVHAEVGIVQGDTFETLDAATKFLEEGIPIAHLYGGDKTEGGYPDDRIRNAVSMLACFHFPSTLKSAENLAKMGVDRSTIFTVGDPIFDLINKKRESKTKLLQKHADGDPRPIAICTLHREPKATDAQYTKAQSLLQNTTIKLGMHILPEHDTQDGRVEPETWLEYMTIASVFITNSSSGIAEAPSFALPCVQVGDRQKGRQTAGNVLWASYDPADIEEKVMVALDMKAKGITWKNPYDIWSDTSNCKRIVDKLVEVLE